MNILIEFCKMLLEMLVAGGVLYKILKVVFEKHLDKEIQSKLLEKKYNLESNLQSKNNEFQLEVNERVHKNDIEISKLKQTLDLHANAAANLSEDQKAIINIFIKFQTNYYQETELSRYPKGIDKNYFSKYNEFQKRDDNGYLTSASKVTLRVIHAAFEEGEELGNKFMNAFNPIVAFNIFMITTCTSENTMNILTFMIQNAYNDAVSDLENGLLVLYSILYQSLVKDYLGLEINPLTLLMININDFNKMENIKIIEAEVRSRIFNEPC